MRGVDVTQESMFSYQTLSEYVPEAHPLRPIREIVNAALREMDETFAAMYADSGRDSIPPEQLLRGLILQSLYGLRSERLLCEQLGYNMLFRWFVGLGVENKPWDHSTYTKNRDRLIEHEVIRELFCRVLDQAKAKGLLSSEHFSVDGTLVRAWASHKSFVPKDGAPPPSSGSRSNSEVDFKGQKRDCATPRRGYVANKGHSVKRRAGSLELICLSVSLGILLRMQANATRDALSIGVLRCPRQHQRADASNVLGPHWWILVLGRYA